MSASETRENHMVVDRFTNVCIGYIYASTVVRVSFHFVRLPFDSCRPTSQHAMMTVAAAADGGFVPQSFTKQPFCI